MHLARDNALGRRIVDEYKLSERLVRPLISIVTVGELLAFARKREWGDRKIDALKRIIRELTVVDIRPQNVIDRYAEIDPLDVGQWAFYVVDIATEGRASADYR